jgi:hypothetical protein
MKLLEVSKDMRYKKFIDQIYFLAVTSSLSDRNEEKESFTPKGYHH